MIQTGSIHFRQILAPVSSAVTKPPLQELKREFLLDWIYQFQAISSNFHSSWQKAPLPGAEHRIFFILDLYISGNIQKLSVELAISRQLWVQLAGIGPPPLQEPNREFFRLDLSISGNFQQQWFSWHNPPMEPPWKQFQTGFINVRQIPATLDSAGRKGPSLTGAEKGNVFLDWIYPYLRQFPANMGSAGRKAPPPQPNKDKFQTGSIHFRQFPVTLGSAGINLSLLQEPNSEFLYWIYPFKTISGNFWFSWQESLPLPRSQARKIFRLDLLISSNFWQLWVQLAESPQESNRKGFQTGYIHFRQFPATFIPASRNILLPMK